MAQAAVGEGTRWETWFVNTGTNLALWCPISPSPSLSWLVSRVPFHHRTLSSDAEYATTFIPPPHRAKMISITPHQTAEFYMTTP